jgi:hypothetical protein
LRINCCKIHSLSILFLGQVERRSFKLLVKRLSDSFQILANCLDPCIGERI